MKRNVAKIISHEKYGNFLNDIALIKLAEPLELSDAIKPIELQREEVPDNEAKFIKISHKILFVTFLANFI